MSWVFWVLIALALGFMIYSSIEDELPESLAVLKSKGAATQVQAPKEMVAENGWSIRTDGANIEIAKSFAAGIERDGVRYDAPTLAFLCSDGRVFARIDTQLKTTGRKATPVRLGRSEPLPWDKASGTNVLAPEPVKLLSKLSQEAEFTFEFEYVDFGRQALKVDTAGIKAAVSQFPPNCLH